MMSCSKIRQNARGTRDAERKPSGNKKNTDINTQTSKENRFLLKEEGRSRSGERGEGKKGSFVEFFYCLKIS